MVFSSEVMERARQDTPGLSSIIHLDNCGSSLMSAPVVDVMKAFLDQEACLGGYVAQEQQSEKLRAVYQSLAKLLGGEARNYALASGAVDAWSRAFYSIPMSEGDNIVTMYNEYCSNYVACLQRAMRDGVEIRVARADASGKLDLDHLASLIDDKTKVVSITHVASSSGQIADVKAVGELLESHDALYLLDACQSVGQLPVNFSEIGCDMATATSRKFLRGPRGVGFLYITEKARALIKPVVLTNQAAAWTSDNEYQLVEDASVFEMWERSCMLQLGFGAALDYLIAQGPAQIYEQVQHMAGTLRSALYDLKDVTPACHADANSAIITFNKEGYTATEVRQLLAEQNITVQVSSIFHTRLDMGARGIDSAVRVSPHYYNNEEEFDRFLNVLEAL